MHFQKEVVLPNFSQEHSQGITDRRITNEISDMHHVLILVDIKEIDQGGGT